MSKLACWQLIRNWWSIEGLKDLPFLLVLFQGSKWLKENNQNEYPCHTHDRQYMIVAMANSATTVLDFPTLLFYLKN